MKAYYIKSQRGCTDPELETAFLFALAKAEQTSPTSKILFAIHTNQNIGWFERIELLKSFKIKELFTGVSIAATTRNITTTVSSIKDIAPKNGDVVIYVSFKDADAFYLDDKLHGIVASRVAIPILPSALDTWKNLWQAQILDPITNPASISNGTYTALDCIVEKALNQMDSVSYKGNTNSSDEDKIKTIVRALYKYNTSINSTSIASYLAIYHNWRPKRAIFVKELYDRLTSGKIFQGGERTGHSNRIKAWKQLC